MHKTCLPLAARARTLGCAAAARLVVELPHQLLRVLQMLLRNWQSLLGNLRKLTFALLLDHFELSDHVDMRRNRGADERLVELSALLLLKFFASHLGFAIVDLTIQLHQLLNPPAA